MDFKRIVWMDYVYLFSGLSLAGYDVWLWISFFAAKDMTPLLIVMVVLMTIFSVALLAFAVYGLTRKRNVITLAESKVILRKHKEIEIPKKDIKKICYQTYGSGGSRKALGSIEYRSGKIIFYLKDGSVVKIGDVKNVRFVCGKLNEKIIKSNVNIMV